MGGTATTLTLNVVTHTVSGVVTMNGQPPISSCGSSDRAYVDFIEPNLGYHHTLAVPCNGATSPFAFSGSVFPGTYRVQVRGYSSNLPSEAFTVRQGLTVSGPVSNLTLDVVTHPVSGVVTMNGQQPTSGCGSSDRAYVDFIEPNLGYHHTLAVPCDGATSPFAFSPCSPEPTGSRSAATPPIYPAKPSPCDRASPSAGRSAT
ncbi:MAG: hypothetical protein H6730_17155 [Deltaproteobacteria bacterium]|nr:hypothetical protein [Deltaproteobacteria bacterium]